MPRRTDERTLVPASLGFQYSVWINPIGDASDGGGGDGSLGWRRLPRRHAGCALLRAEKPTT